MEGKLLYKPNQLIMSTNKDISVSQKKAYNYILFEAREQLKKDPNKDSFNFNISDIKENSGIKNTNNKRMKDDLTTLLTTTVEIIQGDDWDVFTLLSRVKKTNGSVSISLNDVIKDALISNSYYTTLNLLEISQLTGKYAIIIYEMYLRYKKKEIPYLTIEEFKQLTGTVEVKSYENFARLKAKVIEAALDEIKEKIGVYLSYTTKTKGRRVIGIKFKCNKDKAKIEQNLTKNQKISDSLERVIEKVKRNIYISKAWDKRAENKVNKLLKEQGEEYTKDILRRAYEGCKGDIKTTLVQYLNGIMKNVKEEINEAKTIIEKVKKIKPKVKETTLLLSSEKKKEDSELRKYKDELIKNVKEHVKGTERFEIMATIMGAETIEELSEIDSTVIVKKKRLG